ncbi:MAG TPA: hypothetical protein VF004_04400 [Burkholderiales bacterium]
MKAAACGHAEIVSLEVAGAQPGLPGWPLRAPRDALLDLGRYIEKARGADLDVAFALGRYDDFALDGIARLGVWRLHADGAREVVEGAPLTACSLRVRLEAGAEPRIAAQAWTRTERLSIAGNRERVLARATGLAALALRDAQRYGRGWLEQCRATPEKQGRTTISPIKALKVVARNRAASLVASLRYAEQGFIAHRPANGPITPALEHFTRLPGSWRAPFAAGRHIFFEDRGRIGVFGPGTEPVMLFEGAGPSVVENHLMTSDTRLYRCVEFPLKWRFERQLVEFCSHATLHRASDRWWLFATGEFDDELNLFHATKLTGPWIPHARNPVKSDARGARPAGRLYWRNGALYRPALVNAPREAMGVAIHRVLRLTPQEYAERQVETIPGVRAVNYCAELTVVDAFTRRLRFA